MSNHYEEFLRRLVQYRVQLNCTQEKISQELGITQSQLSKQELGKTNMTYKSLVKLMNMGWDVDYLFTGRQSVRKHSELTALLERTEVTERKSMLEFIVWALDKGIGQLRQELSTEEKCEINILKMRCSKSTDESIMYEIRKLSGEAQLSMAEKLGVNIKKYRALERRIAEPDSELLLDIYEATGCKPSLFLITEHVENWIIDDLWSRISTKKQKDILAIVLQIHDFLRA